METAVSGSVGDPLWSDGVNLNLVRSHIIFYRGWLEELVREENIGRELPPAYYGMDNDTSVRQRLAYFKNLVSKEFHSYRI